MCEAECHAVPALSRCARVPVHGLHAHVAESAASCWHATRRLELNEFHPLLACLPAFQVTKSGALDIKILPRTAMLEAPPGPPLPPPEQDIPLQVGRGAAGGKAFVGRCSTGQLVPCARERACGHVGLCGQTCAGAAHLLCCLCCSVPWQVPKKTRLYVEQTQREREQVGVRGAGVAGDSNVRCTRCDQCMNGT